MADRVYPAAKPNPPPAMANGGGGTASFPAPKSHVYQRPIYRPQAPTKRRRGRSCRCSFCCCFCWALLVVILLAFVAAVAGGAFYLLYRPQRPSFNVSSVRLTAFNLSSATAPALTDSIQLTVMAKNPNKKIVFLYDDFSLSAATTANAVPLGSATVPGFAHEAGNTTVFVATIAATGVTVDPTAASSDINKSGGLSVAVDAETRAGVRVGGLKTKKIGIQVHCQGIKVTPPAPPPPPPKKVKGKNATALAPSPDAATADTAATVSTTPHSCEVRVRVKIWKWTL